MVDLSFALSERYGCVKRKHIVDVLRCNIVYPLYQYVRADRVMEFRRLITEIAPDMKGFMEEEKDVEEFLNLIFGHICQVEPDIKLSSNESSYLFQLICSDQQPSSQSCKTVVSVQQLLEQSFFDLNILLKRIPTRFILQILRYGKERLYRGVLPSLSTRVLEMFTFSRFTMFRMLFDRNLLFHCALKSEQDRAVITPPSIDVRSPPSPVILQLAAVLCIESSHYVSFVRVGDRPESDWIFFDSMADREGDFRK
ncbi:Ubiquitin carboxyl-terminal hydrolase CYLD [Trichinella nativa]|uniref:Ubiquitin carboxyl-terminal hydrolase CYLD n=1 Tax=Trichinella nativa TaxID=6335 RepID=A0A0V1LR25_9BILA|nr:Ubiquitin carboxyl-terminal hydrolase CYLD [Trichinella nativa]